MDKNSLKKITKPLAPNNCAMSGVPLKIKQEVGNRVIFADAWAENDEAARSGQIFSGAALDKAAKAEARKMAKKAEKILAEAEAAVKADKAAEKAAAEKAKKAEAKAEKEAAAAEAEKNKKDGE